MKKGSTSQQVRKRLTIGFLIDWLDDTYQQTIISGMSAKAEELDINLFIYEGGAIRSGRRYESSRNIIYDFAGGHNLDGLTILAGAIGHFADRTIIEDFCSRYLPMPVISISYEIENIPSIFVNNRAGMKALVLHFIREHKVKKIAKRAG